jgi:hypothetical protein
MIVSTLEELRLYSPANAIDNIDTIQGFLDSSEQDFLSEKLGQKLYDSLTAYYRQLRDNGKVETFVSSIVNGDALTPYARLLNLCQRCVTFDALGRAVDMQAISVNGAGVNVATATDYAKADNDAVRNYKATCVKEAHAAVNRILVVLEDWTKDIAQLSDKSSTDENINSSTDETINSSTDETSSEDTLTEEKEIVALWRKSRYFFLAASLIIPSASVLQEYLNIYDSREKFIQMLPDLRYLQEDVLAPAIGDDLTEYIVTMSQQLGETVSEDSKTLTESQQRLLLRIIHKARKAMARLLESRTMQFRTTDQRRETARTEGNRLVQDLGEFITVHYKELPDAALDAFKKSPLYATVDDDETNDYTPQFQNNQEGNAMFITPAI